MLSPADIRTKKFTKKMGNYKSDEVEIFLQLVSNDVAELMTENDGLKRQVMELERRVEDYAKMEKVLKESIVVAKITGDEIKDASRKEANMILKEAELEAQNIIQAEEEKIKEVQNRYEALKQEVALYKTKILSIINTQKKLLEENIEG